MPLPHLSRYVAFSTDPAGGNPAGVWVGEAHPAPAEMQRIAADVGYSETAFVASGAGRDRAVRYFSPAVEVPFCGHATIATGVALGAAEGEGTYRLATTAGVVPVEVRRDDSGAWTASLTSVEPEHRPAPPAVVDAALDALGWQRDELDDAIPPALAYAGAWHLVLAAATRERLAALDYDADALGGLLRRECCVTAQLVWRERTDLFHARNPFPVGGVVEDPATGAAAAALGGYLRGAGLATPPTSFTVRQGEDMGRPSVLRVHVPERGGVVVSGRATVIGQGGVASRFGLGSTGRAGAEPLAGDGRGE